MTERITFGDVHALLTDLGFKRGHVEGKPYVLFEHKPSGVLFLFRPHRANERIDSGNLTSVRVHLVYNGFLDDDQFEAELKKRAATRTATPKKT